MKASPNRAHSTEAPLACLFKSYILGRDGTEARRSPSAMMANSRIVLRASPDEFIEIASIERLSDSSGYSSHLSVGSGRFSCSRHPFYFQDLDGFTKAIAGAYERVGGKARLAHNYEKDVIEVEVLKTGQVTVGGVVVEYGPPHQELRFGFGCDQTFLPELLSALKQVARELESKP